MNIPPYNKGALFHKCDFQVHSLRDEHWHGPFHLINDRQSYALSLVADCRRKGINAIAITDHHDLCLWRYVNEAAQIENDDTGTQYSERDKLVVFPGIELTLSNPACQAILLLDPTIPITLFNSILGSVGIVPTNDNAEKTVQTTQLPQDKTIFKIIDDLSVLKLNPEEENPTKFKYLRNHFIILPYVKRGGYCNIIRDGFQTVYASMPCVGGYIEKKYYHELDDKNRNIIEGKIREWGNKALGIFLTSDCREAQAIPKDGNTIIDFIGLGLWPTWVKWAVPSTEAIRQACLAKQSRILFEEPTYPSLQILGVKISNSKFLGEVELGLNPQFNAFIGGRGTGKSSILEYIRWALGDDPVGGIPDTLELPNFQKRRKSLIKETLLAVNATVSVYYKKNEVIYRIDRNVTSRDESISIFDSTGVEQHMTEEQVSKIFPLVSYAQKQLSCVGTLPEEIDRLITDPIKEDLDKLQNVINSNILPELNEQRRREIRLHVLKNELKDVLIYIGEKKEQISALQSSLKELTSEQKEILRIHESFILLQQWMNRSSELPLKSIEILRSARDQISALGVIQQPTSVTNVERITPVLSGINDYLSRITTTLTELIEEYETSTWLGDVQKQIISDIRQAIKNHTDAYNACVEENARSAKQMEEIQLLNKQIVDYEEKKGNLELEISRLQVIYDQFKDVSWNKLLKHLWKRAKLLSKQCRAIGAQAQYEFRPIFMFCADDTEIREHLTRLVEGRNIKGSDEKIRRLMENVITKRHPIKEWVKFIKELDLLLLYKEAATAPETPLLSAANFSRVNIDSLRSTIEQEDIEQMRYINIKDRIKFEFHMGRKSDGSENYIPFDSASPGQQATCLLRTLLSQTGAPLLIDQPEEDLDNEQIQLLSQRIAETKNNRQLLFVSHNANIVVNGDAELVVCFVYKYPQDITQGKMDPIGSIDCEPVREMITSIMEGGKQAFEMRKEKYGF